VAGINVDPHLDVRERPGSGMPYRRLLEAGTIDGYRFSVLALGRYTNAREHLEFLHAHGGTTVSSQQILADTATGAVDAAFSKLAEAPVSFLSIDLDAVDAAYAPGVSARNPVGIRPAIAGDLAERAGRTPSLRHFELVELSPTRDDPAFDPADPATAGRTARLAAYLFRRFVSGVAAREPVA